MRLEDYFVQRRRGWVKSLDIAPESIRPYGLSSPLDEREIVLYPHGSVDLFETYPGT